MWNRKRSEILSIIVCFVCVAVLTAGLFLGPWAVKLWFTVYRGWDAAGEAMQDMLTLFSACFYPCAVLAYITLYGLLRLLFNIKKDAIFIEKNVSYLRRIAWCCFGVAAITLAGGVFYLPFLFVAVAAGFVGLMLRVVKNVMESAVQIKAENELTI